MSDSGGPVRRRRIAGESKPAAPTKKAAPRKTPVVRKPAIAKPTFAKSPVAKKTPVVEPPSPKTSNAPASGPGDRGGPSARDLLWLVPATLVAGAALIVGGWLTVKGASDLGGGGDDDLVSSQRQAASAAGTAAETVFSFRYDQLDEHVSASKALMTPKFAKDFDKIAPVLTELAPQRKIVVQAETRDAAALNCGDECSDTKANILVFIDQARLVGDAKEPTVFANRITISMVKRDGTWLVNNIRAL
jgi:hypothetical protein